MANSWHWVFSQLKIKFAPAELDLCSTLNVQPMLSGQQTILEGWVYTSSRGNERKRLFVVSVYSPVARRSSELNLHGYTRSLHVIFSVKPRISNIIHWFYWVYKNWNTLCYRLNNISPRLVLFFSSFLKISITCRRDLLPNGSLKTPTVHIALNSTEKYFALNCTFPCLAISVIKSAQQH